jgi:hypothetical protein
MSCRDAVMPHRNSAQITESSTEVLRAISIPVSEEGLCLSTSHRLRERSIFVYSALAAVLCHLAVKEWPILGGWTLHQPPLFRVTVPSGHLYSLGDDDAAQAASYDPFSWGHPHDCCFGTPSLKLPWRRHKTEKSLAPSHTAQRAGQGAVSSPIRPGPLPVNICSHSSGEQWMYVTDL